MQLNGFGAQVENLRLIGHGIQTRPLRMTGVYCDPVHWFISRCIQHF